MQFHEVFSGWKDVVEYPSNTTIFTSGDPADVMYYILSGEVELTLRGESLGTEGPGGIVGEMAMLSSAAQSTTATTATAVKLARLNRQQLREFALESTEFSLHVMSILANRLRAIDQFIMTQLEQAESSA